jgi:hypothetical protein
VSGLVVQLPQSGILGGGGGMLGLSFQGFVGARVLLVDETNDISRSGNPLDGVVSHHVLLNVNDGQRCWAGQVSMPLSSSRLLSMR